MLMYEKTGLIPIFSVVCQQGFILVLQMNERSILHVAVILESALMICVTNATTLSASDNDCPELCTCENRQITCFNHIPETVPDAMEELTLDVWYYPFSNFLHPGVFCNVTWQNVRKLSIINNLIHDVLEGDFFCCPNRLHTLTLSSIGFSTSSHSEAPVGLINISNLEIYKGIVRGNSLYYLQNFPTLVSFTFAHSSYNSEDVILDNSFVSILSQRPIKVLNFSSSSITLDFQNSSALCDTLETLILRDSLLTIRNLPQEACASLQLVDLTGGLYYLKMFEYYCINSMVFFDIRSFFITEAMYINQMFTSSSRKTIPSCQVFIHGDRSNFRVKEFHFSQNILPRFEINFVSDIIECINLSHNRMESIALGAFSKLRSCTKVDLSYNKLHFTGIPVYLLYFNFVYYGYHYDDYVYESEYKCIDFSSNNISNLPNGLFRRSSNIEYIKMSNNTLTQVDFDISHLYNLTLLDLRYNNIHSLDSNSRQKLEDLYEAQHQKQTMAFGKKSLKVLLEGNPFSCSCDHKEFIQWFATSPVFDNTRQSHYCKLNQRKYILDHNAVYAAINDCELVAAGKALESKRELLASVLPVLSFIVAIVTVFILIIIYRQRKRKLLRHKFEDKLHLVQENKMKFKFPVFLSYSSLDFDFVANHIRQQLQVSSI